jgi:hypothetical protein
MSTTLVDPAHTAPLTHDSSPTTLSRGRRVAVAATGFLACALPVVFTVSTIGQLVTGTESDHRFHQLTGQGLLLTALWLGGLVPLVRAGWRGVAPSVASVWQVLVVCLTGLGAGIAAPGHGGLALAIIATATSAALYAALPARPSLRVRASGVSVVAAVVAVALAVVMAVFVADQVDLQNHVADEHAEMAHYFDMAWVSLIVVGLALVAALAPAVRRRLVIAGAAVAYIGVARWAITPDVAWSVTAMVTGAVGAVFALMVARRG